MERNQRQRDQQDRARQRDNRNQAQRIADTRRSKERADRRMNNRVNRDVARNGRFASRYYNRNYARVRYAGWGPQRAWRRGLYAGFIPWGVGLGIGAAVFWPYAYNDIFDYTFWPTGYYGGYWAYAYDDFFDGIWWSEEPAFVAEGLAYAPEAGAPPPGAGIAPPPVAGGAPRPPVPGPGRAAQGAPETTGTVNCANTGSGLTAWPFDRMQSSLGLSTLQQDQMESLRDAAARAADAMRDSCPTAAPRNPVERLQAMRDRLEATLEAVKIVRPPLETFYDSLTADQRQRFDALGPKIAEAAEQGRSSAGDACGSDKPGLANFPIEKIQEAVSPTDDQLNLLDALEDATFKAIDIMKAACPTDPPASPGQRLAATQSRIEAMIEAAKAIQPALDDFYASLNDQQKAAFGKMKS